MLLSSYAINRNVTANSTLLLIEHITINRTYTIEMLLLIEHVAINSTCYRAHATTKYISIHSHPIH